jgi:hypothetical protein
MVAPLKYSDLFAVLVENKKLFKFQEAIVVLKNMAGFLLFTVFPSTPPVDHLHLVRQSLRENKLLVLVTKNTALRFLSKAQWSFCGAKKNC